MDLLCSHDSSSIVVILVATKYSRHAKIRYLWVPFLVQQYVTRLEVPVDYSESRVLMKIQKAPANALDDAETSSPIQDIFRWTSGI